MLRKTLSRLSASKADSVRLKNLYLFPGQGIQKVGHMLPDASREVENYSQIIDKSNQILGINIEKLMDSGPEADLNSTQLAQPAIFLSSHLNFLAWLERQKENKVLDFSYDTSTKFNENESIGRLKIISNPTGHDFAGYSLGEFNALVAAGKMTFEDALFLVKIRAHLMQRSCNQKKSLLATVVKSGKRQSGKIEAILRTVINSDIQNQFADEHTQQKTAELFKQVNYKNPFELERERQQGWSYDPNNPDKRLHKNELFDNTIIPEHENHGEILEKEILQVASYMSRNIFTVGGDQKPMMDLYKNKRDYGIIAMKFLNVSGAFHTSLMHGASVEFRKSLNLLCNDPNKRPRSHVDLALEQLINGSGFINIRGINPYQDLRKHDSENQIIVKKSPHRVWSNLAGEPYDLMTSIGKAGKNNYYTSSINSEADAIIRALPLQIESPILWQKFMSEIMKAENDYDQVIEFGPSGGQLGKLFKNVNVKFFQEKYQFVFDKI